MASCQKVPKSDFSKLIFYVFFFLFKNSNLGAQFRRFFIISIFEMLYFLKWCPIFDDSQLWQFTKYNKLLQGYWYLPNFVSLLWKLDHPYYHTLHHLLCSMSSYFVALDLDVQLPYRAGSSCDVLPEPLKIVAYTQDFLDCMTR